MGVSSDMAITEAFEKPHKTSRTKVRPRARNVGKSMVRLNMRPASSALGAEIRGIDLRERQSPATIVAMRDALNEHSLLLFRDQNITPEQHVAFGRRFGKLEHHVLAEYLLPNHPEIFVLSNLKKKGKTIGRAVLRPCQGQAAHTAYHSLRRQAGLGSLRLSIYTNPL